MQDRAALSAVLPRRETARGSQSGGPQAHSPGPVGIFDIGPAVRHNRRDTAGTRAEDAFPASMPNTKQLPLLARTARTCVAPSSSDAGGNSDIRLRLADRSIVTLLGQRCPTERYDRRHPQNEKSSWLQTLCPGVDRKAGRTGQQGAVLHAARTKNKGGCRTQLLKAVA